VIVPAASAPSVDSSWSWEPGVLFVLVLAVGVYVTRWRAARRDGERHPPAVGRLLLWLAGVAVAFAALISPIDAMGDTLLVMHMVQHVLLIDIAPILLILGLTRVLLRPVTRRITVLERRAGVLAHPAFAVCFYVGIMWFWHVPALYDAAEGNDAIHVLEHLCFAAAGGLYWWHLLSPIRGRMRLDGLGPVVYMVVTRLGVGLLGIVLTFAPDALYPHYAHGGAWGLTADEDQSLAGLVMALEQSVIMGVALAWLFVRMLAESEREQERRERYELGEPGTTSLPSAS
jgi:cytochrome c oxidase assembly factor CtaG